MRNKLGLDKPFFERYATWLGDSLKGNFGESYVNNKPVIKEIGQALPATLHLASVSLIITILISVTVGLLLMWIFAVKLNIFPTSGMVAANSVILPVVTLSLSYISTYVRLIRNNMIKNKQENYVLYGRVRGLKESTIIKHIFKNSLQSSITALGMSIPKLIAGTVIVENIFAWPGIGRLCVTAIFNGDYPIIQAYILIMAIMFVV